MSFNFGKNIHIQIFGQSHSEMIGCVIDGLPAGIKIDEDKIASFMARRAPGKDALSTARSESDAPRVVSGLYNGYTCGAPLTAPIANSDRRSSDYESIKNTPRPNHADYSAYLRYRGYADYRGGGAFSGRMTAPLCFAGSVASQLLEKYGVTVGAHVYSIPGAQDTPFDPLLVTAEQLRELYSKRPAVISDDAAAKMTELTAKARAEGNSLGGIIECAALGIPGGTGDPRFDGLESQIALICFGLPAVKGIEFGIGFAFGTSTGAEVNDQMYARDGNIMFSSNNCGGICGGISDGRPVIFRCAFKPTPSIALKQTTVNITDNQTAEIEISGRHDPCVVFRAVPAVESAAAIAVADAILNAPAAL